MDTHDPLLERVGLRVRKARERKGLSRRALSEASDVSPRYLAQLETGTGNISIALLARVARALDQPVEFFIGEDDPWTSDAVRVAGLFRGADKAVKSQVLRLLDPVLPREARMQRVCLVGLRGAGKSTLGRAASVVLDAPFVELNAEIEAQAGMAVAEIMALYGQEGYRRLEADAIDRIVSDKDRMVLAVAGGIVEQPATYAELLARFHTIWLKASPQDHMDRVRAQGDERPMAGNPEAMAQLRLILASREVLYAQAEAQLNTSGKTKEASMADLVKLIRREGFMT